jgi:hypothetical protein
VSIGGFLRRALIAFDVAAAVPPGSTNTGATLELSMTLAASGFVIISV